MNVIISGSSIIFDAHVQVSVQLFVIAKHLEIDFVQIVEFLNHALFQEAEKVLLSFFAGVDWVLPLSVGVNSAGNQFLKV